MITTSDKAVTRAHYRLGVRLRTSTAKAARWLHIYLSMISFGVIFFFAATGITLNHAEWFSQLGHQERLTHYQGVIGPALLHESSDQQPDRLGIVELLRANHKIHGAASDFRMEDGQISVSFRGPGYAADAFIDAAKGTYDLTETRSGFVAVINDLHKGRDTGKTWSVVIDISAVLLVLVSLTGLVLIWFVYKRRTSGLILAVVAGLMSWLVYCAFVP